MSTTVACDELNAVLDHLAGPMPSACLDMTLDPSLTSVYVRGTWFNSAYYLQDKYGKWHLMYPHVDGGAHAVRLSDR
jgi:hypothetical protein